MKFLSKWLMKTANWLSKPDADESPPNIQSQPEKEEESLSLKDLERLSGLLSTLLNTGQSFMLNTDSEQRLSKLRTMSEEAQVIFHQNKLAPHRTYTPKIYNDGVSWIAMAEFSEGPALVGRGDSPSAALEDYDEQWLGIKE